MPITSKTRSLLLAAAVLTMAVLAMTTTSLAQVRVAIAIGPPALPIYEQPVCPGDGYLWTPGYWGYDDDISDYYWVPGTWVMAPEVGFLWTPPYWGWGDGGFVFYDGYWGPHVGFYGGIDYGFGYFGVGFGGGRWEDGRFFYNRAVTNVEITNIHNVYNTTVVHETTVNRVSYNGGNGGITARPTAEQEAAGRERHVPPVSAQAEQVRSARSNPQLRASANQGKPPIAATPRPGEFNARGAMPAKEAGAPYHAPANSGANRGQPEERGNEPAGRPENNRPENSGSRPAAVHPNDLPRAERAAAPNTGNPKMDKKYQQQQEKLNAQQDKERQKLQQKQEMDHERMTKQSSNDARKQQMEQQHQQQTQQLQQRHTTQQQQLQQRQAPARSQAPRGKS